MRLSPKKERNKKCEGHTKIQDSKAHSVHKPTVGKKDVCREQEEGESSPPTLFTIKMADRGRSFWSDKESN